MRVGSRGVHACGVHACGVHAWGACTHGEHAFTDACTACMYNMHVQHACTACTWSVCMWSMRIRMHVRHASILACGASIPVGHQHYRRSHPRSIYLERHSSSCTIYTAEHFQTGSNIQGAGPRPQCATPLPRHPAPAPPRSAVACSALGALPVAPQPPAVSRPTVSL